MRKGDALKRGVGRVKEGEGEKGDKEKAGEIE